MMQEHVDESATIVSIVNNHSPLSVSLSAHSHWWMLLSGETGGEPLQHISVSEISGEELVRGSEKERKT